MNDILPFLLVFCMLASIATTVTLSFLIVRAILRIRREMREQRIEIDAMAANRAERETGWPWPPTPIDMKAGDQTTGALIRFTTMAEALDDQPTKEREADNDDAQ